MIHSTRRPRLRNWMIAVVAAPVLASLLTACPPPTPGPVSNPEGSTPTGQEQSQPSGEPTIEPAELPPPEVMGIVPVIRGTAGLVNGEQLPNVKVTAYALDREQWLPVAEARTNDNGEYTLDLEGQDVDLRQNNRFRVGFEAADDRYEPVFFPNAATVEEAGTVEVVRPVGAAPSGAGTGRNVPVAYTARRLLVSDCESIDVTFEAATDPEPDVAAECPSLNVWNLANGVVDICDLDEDDACAGATVTLSYAIQCNNPNNVQLIRMFQDEKGNTKKQLLCGGNSCSDHASSGDATTYKWTISESMLQVGDKVVVTYYCQCPPPVGGVECCGGFQIRVVIANRVECDPTGHIRTDQVGTPVDVTLYEASALTSCETTANAGTLSAPPGGDGWAAEWDGFGRGSSGGSMATGVTPAAMQSITTDNDAVPDFSWSGIKKDTCYYVGIVIQPPAGDGVAPAGCPDDERFSPMAKISSTTAAPFDDLNFECP